MKSELHAKIILSNSIGQSMHLLELKQETGWSNRTLNETLLEWVKSGHIEEPSLSNGFMITQIKSFKKRS